MWSIFRYLERQARKFRLCSHLVTEHGARERFLMGTNVNTPFFQVPMPEFGHVTVPEYKVETLYSGTELGTNSLCAHVFC